MVNIARMAGNTRPGPKVIKNFMLNTAEHENFPPNNCWHFDIYEQEK